MYRMRSATSRVLLVASLATLVVVLPGNALGAPPQSCADIKAANPSATDGGYVIRPAAGSFVVWCHDMSGVPREYVSLVNVGGAFNVSQYAAGGASPGTDVNTHFERLRIDPHTLLVDIFDVTFATSTGALDHSRSGHTVRSMPFGVGMSCSSSEPGQGNVDLRGTGFFVDDTFVVSGFGANGSAAFGSDDQVVDILGRGFCGGVGPQGSDVFGWVEGRRELFALQLGLTTVPVTIDIKPGSAENPVNLRSKGVTAVAVLSTDAFVAATLDAASVCFGDGEDPAERACGEAHGRQHLEDVDGDGDLDLVLHFVTRETGIDAGDTFACLSGQTSTGQAVEGCDVVQVIG